MAALRVARTVTLRDLAAHPIRQPTSEVLFTSNVLLTAPSSSTDVDSLPYSDELRRELRLAQQEPQQHWYDHPIQIGVAASSNELLYGLRGLDQAIGFERARRPEWDKLRVALSVSVTHDRLQRVAHEYVRTEMASAGGLRNLDVYVSPRRRRAGLRATFLRRRRVARPARGCRRSSAWTASTAATTAS